MLGGSGWFPSGVVRILSLVVLLSLGSPWLGRADYSYLKIDLTLPSNALLTEGLMAQGPSDFSSASFATLDEEPSPPPIVTLYGGLDLNVYRLFNGETGTVPASRAGDLLLAAAKDATYSAHVRMDVVEEGIVAAQTVAILLNSRERMSYDLTTDTFYYGTKAINFPREEPFQIDFQYGGYFLYYDASHFDVVSQSGVVANVSIMTIPEPTAAWMIGAAAAAMLFLRRRGAMR